MTNVKRRGILFAFPGVAVLSPAFAAVTAPDFAAIEHKSGGKLGFFAIETDTGATLSWRADERFPFCSSFKGPLAAFVLWKADQGALRLEQQVRYGTEDLLPYAPVTRAHIAEGQLSLEALCAAAVQYSDNTAANLLLRETGGADALTAWMRKEGDPAFMLVNNEPRLNWARFGDEANTTTPRAMAQTYQRLVLGDVLTPVSRTKLASWLIANTTGDRRLRAGMPTEWRVGDKTGTYDGKWFSTIDVGVAWPPSRSPLVMAGLLTDTPDTASAERALVETGRGTADWQRRGRHIA